VNNKSFLISLAVEAMCVGRVNVMQRRHQARLLNFKGFRTDLQTAIADVEKMRDADAVTHWLQYRVTLPETHLSEHFTLDDRDKALCKQRTITFINAFVQALRDALPALSALENLDVFDPAAIEAGLKQDAGNYGDDSLRALWNLFFTVCCVCACVFICNEVNYCF
jgi:hypothetical protein